MSTVATLNQVRFRFRTDAAAVDSAATWGAAENTAYYPGIETNFRLRFSVNNTGTAAGAGPQIIRVSKNGGAYTVITTSTGATLGAQSADAGASADEAVIATANFRLTAGTGTALAGVYDETGSATKSITNAFYTELEFGLILKTAGAASGDTFDFRIYNSTTAYTTYTQTPRIMVPSALLANDVASASSVSQPAVVIRRDLLANDVSSASSVSQPAVTEIVPPAVLLANDVRSTSTVSQPAAKQLHGLQANDALSASSVTQPTLQSRQALQANDVLSASSVSNPAVAEIGAAAVIAPRAMHQYRMRRAA